MHPNEGSVERCCGAHTAALTGTPSQRPGVTYTGQSQAAWSLAGNTSYVSYGGEFPGLNGINQQGLTRMAVRNLATNKRGPTYTTVPARTIPATTATRTGPGTIKVTFRTAWDYHNNRLTYDLLRDGNTTAPVYTTTVSTKPLDAADTQLQQRRARRPTLFAGSVRIWVWSKRLPRM